MVWEAIKKIKKNKKVLFHTLNSAAYMLQMFGEANKNLLIYSIQQNSLNSEMELNHENNRGAELCSVIYKNLILVLQGCSEI